MAAVGEGDASALSANGSVRLPRQNRNRACASRQQKVSHLEQYHDIIVRDHGRSSKSLAAFQRRLLQDAGEHFFVHAGHFVDVRSGK